MRSMYSSAWLAAIAAILAPAAAQTSTKCNPLDTTCPADPALGKSVTIDFTAGPSSQFTASEAPTYGSSGAQFTVAQEGDAPTLISTWYMMFGRVDVTMQAAPGQGIVSSVVLESDDLDEIDFEWLGGDDNQVQSNYFGKGETAGYNRGAFHSAPGNHDSMHTYSVEWTADSISWIINGATVRTVTAAAAGSMYPQTPMQLKLGVWAGGDPSNAPGTIAWAGGVTNYAAGPYTMTVQSVKATDYSTGTQYTYSGNSGSWQSIRSTGGSINSGASEAAAAAGPAVSESSSSQGESSTTTETTSLPGLPSGWTVSTSGKVVPPSSASSTSVPTSLSLSSSSPAASSSAAAGSGGIVASAMPSSTLVTSAKPTSTSTSIPVATGGSAALRVSGLGACGALILAFVL